VGGGLPFLLECQGKENSGIVIGTLQNPKTRNSISKRMLDLMSDAIEELKFDRDARVLILRSSVPGAFCAGADLKERKAMPPEDVPKFVDALRTMMNELSSLPIPVIAAIDGYALGGGLEMALASDIRIASPSSKLGMIETKWAIIPGAGGTQRLPRIIGVARAKELIMTAKVLSGEEAERIGLVNHVVEEPFKKAMELARAIVKNGPIAIRLAKIAIDAGSQVELASALAIEQQCYAQVVPTKDRLEGLKAFAEKREPIYLGE